MTFEIPITEDVPDGTYTGMLEAVENLPTGGFQNAPYRRWRWLVDVPKNGETAHHSANVSYLAAQWTAE